MKCSFRVIGLPAVQGNHRTSPSGHIYEQNSAKLAAWRKAVAWTAQIAAKEQRWDCTGCPVRMDVEIILPRTKAMKNRRAETEDANKRPDRSKLLRSVEDALESVLYADDAQIIAGNTSKRVAQPGEEPGAVISIEKMG